jgi:hypothetical protein
MQEIRAVGLRHGATPEIAARMVRRASEYMAVRLPLVMMTKEPGNKFSRPVGTPEIYDTAGSLSVMNVANRRCPFADARIDIEINHADGLRDPP